MPVTRSAEKKMRQDKKRRSRNLQVKNRLKDKIKKFRKNPSARLLSEAFSLLDQTVKKKIFHANKAARLKSNLSKLVAAKKTGTKSTKGNLKKISPKKSPARKKHAIKS